MIAAVVVLLSATSTGYGYHRDELYFRMLEPGWGYVDQPPLTPFLARLFTSVFGDTLWAMRIPATLAVAVAILLTALITRELGGGRAAQILSAAGFATASFTLLSGHVLLTSTVDLAVWAAVVLFLVRALLRAQPHNWVVAGAIVGLGLYNKHLIVLLLVGLFVGLLVVGPRSVLRTRWPWLGALTAVVVGLPNLIYQATHGWPQLDMAGAIAGNNPDARVMLLPFQILLIGPPLFVIVVVGFIALFRRPSWRPLRALAVAYLVVLALTLATGGQIYYPFGLLAFLFAAGCVPTVDWGRRPLVIAGVALNAVVSLLIALPLIPVGALGSTPIPGINQVARDQVGWETYVSQIAAVVPPGGVVITSNYGEAGAVARFLPSVPVYSGQNELHRYGPPESTVRSAVIVGIPVERLRSRFTSCSLVGRLDNGVDVDNEEQGSSLVLCSGPDGGWAAVWPSFQHYD